MLRRIFTWWHKATIGTQLFTWQRGVKVGSDESGNRYYREKAGDRRWVIYHGDIEASQIPPEWHAWLHHTVDIPPSEQAPQVNPWEKPHEPNRTGTPEAYRPPGSLVGAGHRAHATGDYEPWRPDA